MSLKIPNPPPDNVFSINLTALKPFLVDLAPGATKGMRTEQEGWQGTYSEILANQTQYGKRAGITDTDYNRFVALSSQYDQIQVQLPPVRKAVEVLKESLAYTDSQRHKLVTQFANSAESHAAAEGGNPTLLTAYEKARAYRSIIADKGVKTRQKNEEAKKSGDGAATAPEPAGPTGPAAGGDKGAEAVSRIPNPPPDIIFTIDLNPLKSFLVDLPPGAMRGMRTEQDGWEDVRQEIVTNQPTYGDRAGIADTDFQRFVALNEQYAQIKQQLPLLEKAQEILEESLSQVDDQRHKLATQFANNAEEHASAEGGDPTLLTAYEKTIAYRAVIAAKGAKTRQKNEEAKKASAGAAGPTGAGAAGATSPTSSAAGATGGVGPATG